MRFPHFRRKVMNSLNVEIQNPFKVRDDFDLKFANAIEKCRANIQSKVTELVTSYNESNNIEERNSVVNRIHTIKTFIPQITSFVKAFDKNLGDLLDQVDLKVRTVEIKYPQNTQNEIECGDSDINDHRAMESQKIKDLLSKIDWTSNDWKKHILDFEKLGSEDIKAAIRGNNAVLGLDVAFLHYLISKIYANQYAHHALTLFLIDEFVLSLKIMGGLAAKAKQLQDEGHIYKFNEYKFCNEHERNVKIGNLLNGLVETLPSPFYLLRDPNSRYAMYYADKEACNKVINYARNELVKCKKIRNNTIALLDESMKNFFVANKKMLDELNQISEAMDKNELDQMNEAIDKVKI